MQRDISKRLAVRYRTFSYKNGFTEDERYVIKETRHNLHVNGEYFTSVMLVPDKQKEFVYGFLFTSGIIESASDVVSYRMCENFNIYVYLQDPKPIGKNSSWTITSGCGGGKVLDKTFENVPLINGHFEIKAEQILELYKQVEIESDLHSATRCVHKAYFLGKSNYKFSCDDIGRHNTIDKAIGSLILNNAPSEGILLSTGRLTSEMILKCSRAQIPVVVSRTAPSKLGVDLAVKSNMTLVGLASSKGFTIFNDPGRIK